MNRLWLIFALFLISVSSHAVPNIILIFADDLGVEACAPYGGTSWTMPTVDSLSTGGMTFSNMRSCPACAVSRATLLTGRYSALRQDPLVLGPNPPFGGMDTNEVTIADVLTDSGYSVGVSGKWGLAVTTYSEENFVVTSNHATACGFPENFLFPSAGMPLDTAFSSPTNGPSTYWPSMENNWAIDFVENHATNSEPFFLYYSLSLPKGPFGPTLLNPTDTGLTDNETFDYLIQQMDLNVSNLLDRVDSLGISSNTLVMFIGDNGTLHSVTSTNNGSIVEGGKLQNNDLKTWVPGYAYWPGVIGAGTTYDGLTAIVDVFNTIAEAGGAFIPTDRLIDGRSFYDGLLGTSQNHRDTMYNNGLTRENDWYWTLSGDLIYESTHIPASNNVVITDFVQSDVTALIRLQYAYTNIVFKDFGDRPWGGSTNEYIFSEE